MEKIDIINSVLKFLFNSIIIYFISLKITNNKNYNFKNIVIIIISSLIFSTVYTFFINYANSIIILLILYFIYCIVLSYVSKISLRFSTVVTAISLVMCYMLYLVSVIICSFIVVIIDFNVEYDSHPINLLIIFLIQYILLYNIFKIKRFKYGFIFLKDMNKIENFGIWAFLFSGIILIVNGLLYFEEKILLNLYLCCGIILALISFISWIESEITKRYKENMKNRTIELQKIEIDEKVEEIKELKDNNLKLSTIIHKYNNRLSAMERAVIKILNNNLNTEFSKELNPMLENIKAMSKEFSKEILGATNEKKKLPKTSVQSIDNIFEYMAEEAANSKINFNLKINNSINYLIENIVDVKEFETLIGDHIRDAIIAINSEETEYKSIMCILGIIDNCYEFSIYDTGIEFEINTLLNLGLKHITTHSETGGTGIGFMTSFETLNKYKGSLIIEEYSKETNIYTKSVTFRFDKKGEYRIYSYRSDQIKSKMNDKNRIKVKQI